MLDRRSWKRDNWTMITKKTLTWFEFEGGFCGALKMQEVSEPFCVGKQQLVICDKEITWIQCGWKGKDIWATAMFDATGHLFQIYFDVAEVHFKKENTEFIDWIVDVVYDPSGKASVLDMNELDEAYQQNWIDKGQKQEISKIALSLKNDLESHFEQVNSWFEMMYEKVKKIL